MWNKSTEIRKRLVSPKFNGCKEFVSTPPLPAVSVSLSMDHNNLVNTFSVTRQCKARQSVTLATTVEKLCSVSTSGWGAGTACWLERRTRDRKLRVRIPAGAAGEFSSPVSTLCANSYSVSVPTPCYHSCTLKTSVILPKVQVAGYT